MNITEGLDPQAIQDVLADRRVSMGLKVSPKARIWRGVDEEGDGGGMAVYGLGLYTTTSKTHAAKFGTVREMSKTDLPDKPLRFATVNDFQIWYGQAIKRLGFDSKLDVGRRYPDFADFIRALTPEVDGIQIGSGNDTLFVRYP